LSGIQIAGILACDSASHVIPSGRSVGAPCVIMSPIARFIVTIEGPGWTEVEDVELPRLPDEGESLETKFGTMRVASAEEAPDLAAYAGRIVVRFS